MTVLKELKNAVLSAVSPAHRSKLEQRRAMQEIVRTTNIRELMMDVDKREAPTKARVDRGEYTEKALEPFNAQRRDIQRKTIELNKIVSQLISDCPDQDLVSKYRKARHDRTTILERQQAIRRDLPEMELLLARMQKALDSHELAWAEYSRTADKLSRAAYEREKELEDRALLNHRTIVAEHQQELVELEEKRLASDALIVEIRQQMRDA